MDGRIFYCGVQLFLSAPSCFTHLFIISTFLTEKQNTKLLCNIKNKTMELAKMVNNVLRNLMRSGDSIRERKLLFQFPNDTLTSQVVMRQFDQLVPCSTGQKAVLCRTHCQLHCPVLFAAGAVYHPITLSHLFTHSPSYSKCDQLSCFFDF